MLNNYLNAAVSPYHVVKHAIEDLKRNGYVELNISEKMEIEKGGKYFICPYRTALFAFEIPDDNITSIRIGCAHTDFPTFKIKPVMDVKGNEGNVSRINVEPYGGSLKRTWFDRPLGIAGCIVLKSNDPFNPDTLLFDSEKPWVYIPSLAPHMDRDIEKKEIDVQKEILPVAMLSDSEKALIDYIVDKVNTDYSLSKTSDDVLSFDLNLYDVTNAQAVGVNEEFVSSQRIDNEASVAALVNAMFNKEKSADYISMIALFDNEEIGSRSKQGADSKILPWVIKKICESDYCKNKNVDYKNILLNGMLASVDGAHAVHPCYTEKADITTTALLGRGLVIKTSASQRYVSDPKMIGIVRGVCDAYGIPCQIQANKSGTPGGQTLGPIVSSYLPIPAVDMGIPMLAMHSAREMAAVKDYDALVSFLSKFL